VDDLDTFGPAGRAGGIDHVSQIVGPDVSLSQCSSTQRQRIAQYHRHAGIAENPLSPLRRMRRIERHVGPSRLEDSQHSHDHRGRTLQKHSHPRLRPHAHPPQPAGQFVRPPVQLSVGQRRVAAAHRHRVRPPRRLRRDELMDAQLLRPRPAHRARAVHRRVAPLQHHLMALSLR